MIPHCGPPNSLSPLKSVRSAPPLTLSSTVGSWSPKLSKILDATAAQIVDDWHVFGTIDRHQFVDRRLGDEAA